MHTLYSMDKRNISTRVTEPAYADLQRMATARHMSVSGLVARIVTLFAQVEPMVIDAPPGYADADRTRTVRVILDAQHSVEVLASLAYTRKSAVLEDEELSE